MTREYYRGKHYKTIGKKVLSDLAQSKWCLALSWGSESRSIIRHGGLPGRGRS